MKIVVDDKIPYLSGQVEQLADEVVYLPGADIGPADVREADALMVRTRTLCNRQLLEGSRVRFIVTATIGYDHLDTAYLDASGIGWTNCPGCNATSVAQYVCNSLLAMEQQGLVRLGEATLGIVGYGHVGRAVYAALRPYVRDILVNDPPLFECTLGAHPRVRPLDDMPHAPGRTQQAYVPTIAPLSALCQHCDIITLHTPLTTEVPHPTHHLADARFMAALERKPILINAARGGVVDEEALLNALDEGRVRQAVIDTWEDEPHINRRLLQQAFIATPHIAGYSADGKANATRMALEALAAWAGRPATFCVEPPAEPSDYNPLSDSARLKADPEGFEYQRGHYPLRREKWD